MLIYNFHSLNAAAYITVYCTNCLCYKLSDEILICK